MSQACDVPCYIPYQGRAYTHSPAVHHTKVRDERGSIRPGLAMSLDRELHALAQMARSGIGEDGLRAQGNDRSIDMRFDFGAEEPVWLHRVSEINFLISATAFRSFQRAAPTLYPTRFPLQSIIYVVGNTGTSRMASRAGFTRNAVCFPPIFTGCRLKPLPPSNTTGNAVLFLMA